VFANLILALVISVPAWNLITHGTHITVAHAMGSTIGINSMILLASIFFVIREELPLELHSGCSKQVTIGYWVANVSLAVFFISLILAGLGKGFYDGGSFQEMMLNIRPFLLTFVLSGVTLMLGLGIVLIHAIRLISRCLSAGNRELQGQAELA
jgi:nitric oxide reductase subunit B